ncbi:MAG TPA: DUF3108 domain-containing protein, partial [Polyangiaceae bacterium]|nr:DUF3108 domain-containing protein [Polyangiaceae bacterium]
RGGPIVAGRSWRADRGGGGQKALPTTSVRLAAIAVALVTSLTTCTDESRPPIAGGTAAPTTSAAAPSAPRPGIAMWSGEHLVAEVSTSGVAVGEYELWVDKPCQVGDRPALPITSRAERLGIYAAFDASGADAISWVDALSGRPIQTRSKVIAGKHTKHYVVVFELDHFDYLYERHSTKGVHKHFRIAKTQPTPAHVPVHDMHSTLALLRSWANEMGTRGVVHTVVGRHLYRLEVAVAAKEAIEAAGSRYDAIRIDGVARRYTRKLKLLERRQRWRLWLSDEPIHMPVRAELEGRHRSFLAELLEYRHPKAGAPSPPFAPCSGMTDAAILEQEVAAQQRERIERKTQPRSQSRVDM